MTDKQQIEQLEKDLDKIFSSNFNGDYESGIKDFAKRLYNAGYRKVPKDAVVLTREEYNALREESTNATTELIEVDLQRINARKETAKEFAEGIIKMLWNRGRDEHGKMFEYGDLTSIDVWQLAKQFGVEVQ